VNSPILPADLKAEFAKDFANDLDADLQRSIDRAYKTVGDAWGTLADDGALYLAAHLRTVAKRGANGASGPVQSKRVGDIAVTYAVPQISGAGSLESTAYGMEFLRMLYTLPEARIGVDPSDNYYDNVPCGPWSFSGT
jgi:hypothetical protein